MKKILLPIGFLFILTLSLMNTDLFENKNSNSNNLIDLMTIPTAQAEDSFWDTWLWVEEWKECTVTEEEGRGILGWLGFTSIDTPIGGVTVETTTYTYPGTYSSCEDGDSLCWSNGCERV